MATNYTGDPTAAESPGIAPALGGYPLVVIPDDGDDLDAASVTQAYKALADFIAFAQQKLKPAYDYKANTRKMWVPASMMTPMTAGWTFGGSTAIAAWIATTANATLQVPIPLFFQSGSSTIYQDLLEVSIKLSAGGTGNASMKLWSNAGMSGSNSISGTQVGATIQSTGTGSQLITLTGITGAASNSDHMLCPVFQSAQANDSVYGALITYDNSLWL